MRAGETVLVLDAGTGIRELGVALDREQRRVVHLLLTHLHLDHVEGLGFFGPIWRRETELHVWGPPSPLHSLDERIARYLSPPLFPVHLSEIPASITFHDAPDGDWEIDGLAIRSHPVAHRGPTVGYRVSANGRSLTYIPDHEPALGGDLADRAENWISGHALADGTSVLLHDGQYSEEEYPQKLGWVHSSVADAVAFALRASAGELVLFHHDPHHADGELEVLRARAEELWEDSRRPSPSLAYDGMEIEL